MKKQVMASKADGGLATFRKKMAPYIFTGPFFILFLIFGTFPIFYSLFLSFQSWNGIREMQFVGFDNYTFLLFKDTLFWKSIFNTIVMMFIGGIPQHVFGLFFAFILNQGLVKFREFFKAILFVPYVTSTVAIALLFGILYGTNYGFLNYLFYQLQSAGIIPNMIPIQLPVEWIKEYMTWFSISFISFWKWMGWNAIIYFAGLQSIPDSLYEAAKIDGANWGQIFFKITVPLLMPIIYFATALTVIGGMQAFDEVNIMIGVGGLPGNRNFGLTTQLYMYAWAFSWGKFGLSSAISYLLSIVIVVFSLIHRSIFQEKQ
jgi:ABC-type sugar transport system permease subunit